MIVTRAIDLQSPTPSGSGSVTCRALLDTGASNTAIAKHILEALGLQPTGVGKVRTVNQVSDVAEYATRIRFENGKVVEVVAFGGDFPTEFGCLIGRDVLANAVLVYDGPQWSFELRFA